MNVFATKYLFGMLDLECINRVSGKILGSNHPKSGRHMRRMK